MRIENWTEETKSAYLACAIDTDGWVGLTSTQHTDGYLRITPNVGVTNTSQEFLRRLSVIAGIPFNIGRNGKIGRDSRGITTKNYVWQSHWRSPLHVVKILELAIPYLIVKQERAIWVWEYAKSRITENGKVNRSGRRYTERDWELVMLVTNSNGNKTKRKAA